MDPLLWGKLEEIAVAVTALSDRVGKLEQGLTPPLPVPAPLRPPTPIPSSERSNRRRKIRKKSVASSSVSAEVSRPTAGVAEGSVPFVATSVVESTGTVKSTPRITSDRVLEPESWVKVVKRGKKKEIFLPTPSSVSVPIGDRTPGGVGPKKKTSLNKLRRKISAGAAILITAPSPKIRDNGEGAIPNLP